MFAKAIKCKKERSKEKAKKWGRLKRRSRTVNFKNKSNKSYATNYKCLG
jgi:hypothetical protein